jgi:hypothetical protein
MTVSPRTFVSVGIFGVGLFLWILVINSQTTQPINPEQRLTLDVQLCQVQVNSLKEAVLQLQSKTVALNEEVQRLHDKYEKPPAQSPNP